MRGRNCTSIKRETMAANTVPGLQSLYHHQEKRWAQSSSLASGQ